MTKREINALYYPAVRDGDVAVVRRLLDEHPDHLRTQKELDHYLHTAARHDRVGVMELLVEQGANANAPYTDADPGGPIVRAAMNGSTNALRWLLQHGAPVTLPDDVEDPCPGLTLAAIDGHLECVKLLVEAGAPLASSGDLALFAAKMKGHKAVVNYLRSVGTPEKGGLGVDAADSDDGNSDEEPHGTEDDPEKPDGAADTAQSDLRRHLELRLLGTLAPDSFQELLPSDPPITVLVLDQFGVRQALVTEGMSSVAMNGRVPYAELVLFLPADWPLDAESVRDDRHGWPVNWIRRLAHAPHESGTGYNRVVTFEHDAPLGPGTRFTAILMLAGRGDNMSYVRGDGETVVLYELLPLYPEEVELADREGLPRLMQLFDEHDLSPEVDVDRASVVPVLDPE